MAARANIRFTDKRLTSQACWNYGAVDQDFAILRESFPDLHAKWDLDHC